MKNKKIFTLLICVLIIILISLYFITKNFNNKTSTEENNTLSEYTPEEEISSAQLRETIVTLYFADSNNGELKNEGKLIDSASLVQNPYKKLVELLLEGPQSQNLCKVFPENTQILDAKLENDCILLNFSEDILNFKDENEKYNIINSLLNTLCNLNEVNSVKILVNNNNNENFNEQYTKTEA